MKNTTELVHKYLRNNLSINDKNLIWYVWKYELIHKVKVGQYLELKHIEKHIYKLSNPDSILRIKRKILEK